METSESSPNKNKQSQTDAEIIQLLSNESQQAIILANHLRQQVKYISGDEIYTELLLIGISEATSATPLSAKSALAAYGINRRRLVTELLNPRDWGVPENLSFTPMINKYDSESLKGLPFSFNTMKTLHSAMQICSEKGSELIRPRHIFAALLENSSCYATAWLSNETNFDIQAALKILKATREDQVITPELFGYSPGIATADSPASIDTLGFSQATQALAEMLIKKETVPPVVFGIYGDWGSGKSTFMFQVKELLEKWGKQSSASKKNDLPRVLCVSYNAWSYTDASKLWMGLVKEISKKLDAEIRWWQRPFYWLKRSGWQFVGSVIISMIPVIAGIVWAIANPLWDWAENTEFLRIIIALLGSWSSVKLLGQKKPLSEIVDAEIRNLDKTEPEGVINRIQKEFQETIKDYFKLVEDSAEPVITVQKKMYQNKLKVVVFIDELDRCPLEKIVDILEAIKLFLAEEIFIVLIAIDPRVASEAIKLHYKDVKNPALAQEYLEKIIQVPIPIPSAKPENLTNYLNGLMSLEPRSVSADVMLETEGNQLGSQTGEMQLSVQPDLPFRPINLYDTLDELHAIAAFGEKYLDRNPRRIKRLLNTYRYVKILAHRNGMRVNQKLWQEQMVLWLGVTMRWPGYMKKVVQQIGEQPEELDWENIFDATNSRSSPPSQILAMLPREKTTILEYSFIADHFIKEMAV